VRCGGRGASARQPPPALPTTILPAWLDALFACVLLVDVWAAGVHLRTLRAYSLPRAWDGLPVTWVWMRLPVPRRCVLPSPWTALVPLGVWRCRYLQYSARHCTVGTFVSCFVRWTVSCGGTAFWTIGDIHAHAHPSTFQTGARLYFVTCGISGLTTAPLLLLNGAGRACGARSSMGRARAGLLQTINIMQQHHRPFSARTLYPDPASAGGFAPTPVYVCAFWHCYINRVQHFCCARTATAWPVTRTRGLFDLRTAAFWFCLENALCHASAVRASSVTCGDGRHFG